MNERKIEIYIERDGAQGNDIKRRVRKCKRMKRQRMREREKTKENGQKLSEKFQV